MVAFGFKSDPPAVIFVIIIIVTETHRIESTGEVLGKSRQAGDKSALVVSKMSSEGTSKIDYPSPSKTIDKIFFLLIFTF